MKLGNTDISKVYLGGTEVTKAYLGDVMVHGSALPYDAEVEYLESTGTQWIDTGINLRQKLHTTMDIMITKNITTNSCLCGLFVDSSYPRYQLYINGNQQWATLTTTNAQYYNYSGITAGASVSKNTRYTPTLNSLQVQNYDMTIYLFARNHATSKLPLNGLRMYSCDIVDENNVKLREFIPVRVGQTGYLYDKVSGTLFGNAGSGNFILGDDV